MKTIALIAALALPVAALAAPTAVQAQASAPAAGGLTNTSLQAMLVNMGYEPKALSKGYLVALKRDTWTLNVQVVLSPDNAKIGFNANMGEVTTATVTAKQWMDLLVANGDIDPSAFYFDAKNNKLYLHRAIDNRDVTPSFLRGQLDNFMNQIISTADVWTPMSH